MTILALALALTLLLIAAIHAYWGIGGVWPGHDAESCAKAVVGSRGIKAMPSPLACFAVVAALAVAAVIALAQGGYVSLGLPTTVSTLLALGVMLVFLGRGIAGYIPAWQRMSPEQPFARLDRQLYSPLCLAIGLGFAVLLARSVL